MNRRDISTNLNAFLRLQELCAAIILAVWAIFWAMDRSVDLTDVAVYVLIQVNLSFLAIRPLKFLYSDSRTPYWWAAHLAIILGVSVAVVTIAVAVVYRVDGGQGPFLQYLRSGWKFPFVANVVFSAGFETYYVTKCRLEMRNRQLQRTITLEAAQREVETEELKQARDIQRGLLPKEIPQLPEFAIAGAWEPARVVGGDYYDVIPLSKDRLAICIADVAGKGISAALLMANVQAAVRAFAAEDVSPSRVCEQINSVLCTNTAPDKFVTLFYGVLDAKTRTLRYTNAGHPRPLLIGKDGKAIHLENDGALLGVFPDWKYEDSTVQLERGNLLMLFTDGITEAAAPGGEEFGEERLIAATKTGREHPLAGLQFDVLGHVKEFCNSQMSDDATLLMVAAAIPETPDKELIGGKNTDETLYARVQS
jgi:sigma-B regulation protein RsbU (phosphoserine phosphatase)